MLPHTVIFAAVLKKVCFFADLNQFKPYQRFFFQFHHFPPRYLPVICTLTFQSKTMKDDVNTFCPEEI